MKKIKEREIRSLVAFGLFTALAADVLCILYLFDLVQYHWFLSFIEVLAILLHVTLALFGLMRKLPALTGLGALLAAAYTGILIYGNL